MRTPLLLLHGNPDTHHVWEGVVPLLDGWTCLTPDLPGFGGTPPMRGPITLEGMAAWTDTRVPESGRVHLVAHDFGGPFALAWAVLHEDRVASVTLTNTLFHEGFRWHRFARMWRTPLLGELAAQFTSYRIFRAEVRRGGPGLSEGQIRDAYDRVTPATRRAILPLYRAHGPDVFTKPVPGRQDSWAEAWRALGARVPSQVLWGERDPYLPPESADKLGCQRIIRFPDSGHWLCAEDPEGFSAPLRELLEQVDG